MTKLIMVALVFGGIGYFWGWVGAHAEVARECERLGKFYVGDKVFECRRITEREK